VIRIRDWPGFGRGNGEAVKFTSSASTGLAVRGPMGDAGAPLVEEVVLGSHLQALMASEPTEGRSEPPERHTVMGRLAAARKRYMKTFF
jgi:hypothetical protein